MNIHSPEEILCAAIVCFLFGTTLSFLYVVINFIISTDLRSLVISEASASIETIVKRVTPKEIRISRTQASKAAVILLDLSLISITALIFPAFSYIFLDGVIRLELYLMLALGFALLYIPWSYLADHLCSYIVLLPILLVALIFAGCQQIGAKGKR